MLLLNFFGSSGGINSKESSEFSCQIILLPKCIVVPCEIGYCLSVFSEKSLPNDERKICSMVRKNKVFSRPNELSKRNC